jgi:ferredoxin
MTFQRIAQTLSLSLFALLLWQAAFPLDPILPVDTFLRLDPLVLLGTVLSGRILNASLLVALPLIACTALLGRFTCSTLCPMGTTIDVMDHLLAERGKRRASIELLARLRLIKYEALLIILTAALLGVSLVYLASPLSWITRLYGLILHPALSFLADLALGTVRSFANHWNVTSLAYAQVTRRHFDLQWFTVIFFAAIIACVRYSPRFWCRYLCPSGAILAVVASRPLLRRQVSDECTHCGLCIEKCPMAAISENPRTTNHRECIVCENCVRICPTGAVSFKTTLFGHGLSSRPVCLGRRKVLLAGMWGMGAALVTLTGLRHTEGNPGPAKISHLELIRPPGAVPERDFLACCVGCGECMKACPTNTLQPVGLDSGVSGFFSPVVTPHRGPCEPLCNICGHVCPTGAVRPLPLEEKIWARVGTAHVLRDRCIAWEQGKKCLICAEFCTYGAVEFKTIAGLPVPVPFVHEKRCSGCGLCEHNCPVQARSAIIVEPMGAMRFRDGSYQERGREMGLSLSVRRKEAAETMPFQGNKEEGGSTSDELPPGFTD